MGRVIKNAGSTLRRRPGNRVLSKKIKLQRRCTTCHGAGRISCEFCRGRGEVRLGSEVNGDGVMGTCSACYGGRFSRCYKCKGTGLV